MGNSQSDNGAITRNLETWKRRRFPRLFGGARSNSGKIGKRDAGREAQRLRDLQAKSSLEREYRKLVDSQREVIYLIAGEDANTAREMLFWPILDFFTAQDARQRVTEERAAAIAAANKGSK